MLKMRREDSETAATMLRASREVAKLVTAAAKSAGIDNRGQLIEQAKRQIRPREHRRDCPRIGNPVRLQPPDEVLHNRPPTRNSEQRFRDGRFLIDRHQRSVLPAT